MLEVLSYSQFETPHRGALLVENNTNKSPNPAPPAPLAQGEQGLEPVMGFVFYRQVTPLG